MKLKILILIILSLLLSSCSSDTVTIKGTFSNCKNEDFSVSQVLPNGAKELLTFTTDKKGKFSVEIPKPNSAEFITITNGMSDICLIVDSVTTMLNVQSDNLTKYSASGNYDSELLANVKNTLYDMSADSIKPYLQKVILENPKSLCSYYCYFIIINGDYVFNPFLKEDYPYLAAFANQMAVNYATLKETEYAKNLLLSVMKSKRKVVFDVKDNQVGGFEISLPDINQKTINLSSLKGKVVLLDFTLYGSEDTPKFNEDLKRTYNKYKDQGLEIYQVGLDLDYNTWRETAVNLPWICVYDELSLYSNYLVNYNVVRVPEYFLIDRNGDLYSRNGLESDIEKLLKQ
ncbi:MAG: TlpA family protein disulfide reductase [Paludibacteraceae bacterium]|nr:TlpA family protein disulfide reductase [Paludibacteraceae bacterium]